MNIKNLLGLNSAVTPPSKSASADRPIKSENAEERDGNGQEFYQRQQKKEKMTDDQFDRAIAILKDKPFIKEMNWVVVTSVEGGWKFAWVQDQTGSTIRKIIEYDLWEVFDSSQQIPHKGQLLKRTA